MLNAFYRAMEAIGYNHPVHPTQVNMPIGLVVGALVLALAGVLVKKPPLSSAARYSIAVAFFFVIVTVAAGVMDWLHYYSGVWLFPIKVKVGLATFLFFLLGGAILLGRRSNGASAALIAVYVVAFFTVVTLGYFGANLVFGGRTPPAASRYKAGEEIYRLECSGCHPYGGNAISPDDHVIGSDKLRTPDIFFSWIRNPRAPMPPFPPKRISDGQAKELYDYASQL